jgi:hypothetical protein
MPWEDPSPPRRPPKYLIRFVGGLLDGLDPEPWELAGDRLGREVTTACSTK